MEKNEMKIDKEQGVEVVGKGVKQELELFLNARIDNTIEEILKGIVDELSIKKLLKIFKNTLTLDSFIERIHLFFALDYINKHDTNPISTIHKAYKRSKHFVKDKNLTLNILNLPNSKTPFEPFYEQLGLLNDIHIILPSQVKNLLNPFANIDFDEIKNNNHPLKKGFEEWCGENNIPFDEGLEFLQNNLSTIDYHIKWSEYFNEKYENCNDRIVNHCEKNYLLLISLASWANHLNYYCDNNKITEQPEEYLWVFHYYLDWYEKILFNVDISGLIN